MGREAHLPPLLVGAHDDGTLHSPDPFSEPSAHGSI
jgi:hypothetical protein